MKQVLKLLTVLLVLSIMFVACSANTGSNTEDVPQNTVAVYGTDMFDDMMNFDDMIKDVENVDFYLKADFQGLTVENEKDDESAIAVNYYYDGDTLVYADYIGYGEDCFDYYTKSKSGRDITVKYTDQNSQRYNIQVEANNYLISFSELNKEDKYRAEYITATVMRKAENDLPKQVTYTYEGGKTYISNGNYYNMDGYHLYTSYPNGDVLDKDDTVIYKKADSVNVNESLPSMLADYRVKSAELAVGDHKLEYTENADGEKQWYIVADIYAVFTDKNKALDFSDKYGVEVNKSDVDEDLWVALFEGSALPISEKFDDFFEFAQQEVNDEYYCTVVLDKDGALKTLDRSTAKLTYF